ncbi:MAG TPA: pyrroline-5-carboxylate reductase [Opitutaceae bacterium]|nr:pyrroline-5-carboxylate reductase [Opitutaceae bacterium]
MSSTLAFLGAGRMASAIIDGLIANGIYTKDRLICLGGSGKSSAALVQRTGIRLANTLDELLAQADTLVVAFKPQHLASADPRLAELTAGKLVISVLAAKTLARLQRTFPRARNIVRTMPNTPSAIGAGMTGWCSAQALSPDDRAVVLRILGAIGREVELPESQIDPLMAISGCGPAYIFEFTAALREAGAAAGLDRDTAQMLAIETILGAAKLMAKTGTEPEELRNQVTSPNGTTFAALKRFEAHGFRAMVADAVNAAKARSEEISRDA